MLMEDFRDLLTYSLSWMSCAAIFHALSQMPELPAYLFRLLPYLGVLALIMGAVVFVKTAKIVVYEYLFYKNMTAGVPVLVVNVITILLSLTLGGWLLSELFNFKVVPLLATSAIFSIVLGLALQDTLGNLFSGLALQIDKPYSIGDWIEVQSGGHNWIGIVREISWRSTVLQGFTDEWLTIPNRIMGSAQISNYATHEHPIWRTQTFKVTHGQSVDQVKKALLDSVQGLPEILSHPAPVVLLREVHESWITFRLSYCIRDYGMQFEIGDHILTRGIDSLKSKGIKLAAQRVELLKGFPEL